MQDKYERRAVAMAFLVVMAGLLLAGEALNLQNFRQTPKVYGPLHFAPFIDLPKKPAS